MKEADKLIEEVENILNEYNNVDVDKIEHLYTIATKTTSAAKDISVQSTPNTHSKEEVLLLLAQISKDYDECQAKIKEIYSKLEDRDLRIYFDKVYFHISNTNLEIKYGLTRRQIQRIVKKIEKKRKCRPNVAVKG